MRRPRRVMGWGSSESRRAGLQAHNCKTMPRFIAATSGTLAPPFDCRPRLAGWRDDLRVVRLGFASATAPPPMKIIYTLLKDSYCTIRIITVYYPYPASQ
jgi:hypothetical protein